QRRRAERRGRTTPQRGGGNYVFTSLLRCAHCQSPMQGKNFPVQRKGAEGQASPGYVCGGYQTFGKRKCYYHTVQDRPLLAAVLRKVREKFPPAFLEQCRLAFRAEAAADHTAEEAERLARQVEALDRRISRATRRLLDEEDPRVLGACRAEIQTCHDEREKAQAALEAVRRAAEGKGDPEAEVEKCMALLGRLDVVLPNATPAEVRAVLRDHLERVELWFDHEQKGRETRCRFARGLIYLR